MDVWEVSRHLQVSTAGAVFVIENSIQLLYVC
jgi:hypothetical protein